MAFIGPADAAKVRTFFGDNLRNPVTIELFTEKKSLLVVPGRRECEYCEETEQLLGEVAELSEQVTLIAHDLKADPEAGLSRGIEPSMIPAFVLNGENRGAVRHFGIPAGYEFSSLIQDLVDVSNGETGLSQATKDGLATIESDVHIRVFVTPT